MKAEIEETTRKPNHGTKEKTAAPIAPMRSGTPTGARLGAMQIGLPQEACHQVCVILNRVLANEAVLQIKTRKAHWDIVGPQFYALHKLWDEQYTLLAERIDDVAERIRMLGGFPVGTMAGWLEHATLVESPGEVPDATAVVTTLVNDHETLVRTLRAQIAAVDEQHGDVGTADFLTGLLRDHESMAWMLRSFVQGESVHATLQTKAPIPEMA